MVGRVYKVSHILLSGGTSHRAISDLIFKGDRPILVFEWSSSPGSGRVSGRRALQAGRDLSGKLVLGLEAASDAWAMATIRSTLRLTRSAAIAGSRSYWPSALRYSIARFCP